MTLTHSAVQKFAARMVLPLAIIALFTAPNLSAQGAQPDSRPPVQPGQTAPQQPQAPVTAPPVTPQVPAQAPPSAQTPQPQTGQSKPATPQNDTRNRIRVRSDLVIVPVTVKNREGNLIGDLQRDEFRVFCDDVEQQIIFFTSDPFPLSAVVLIAMAGTFVAMGESSSALVIVGGLVGVWVLVFVLRAVDGRRT